MTIIFIAHDVIIQLYCNESQMVKWHIIVIAALKKKIADDKQNLKHYDK